MPSAATKLYDWEVDKAAPDQPEGVKRITAKNHRTGEWQIQFRLGVPVGVQVPRGTFAAGWWRQERTGLTSVEARPVSVREVLDEIPASLHRIVWESLRAKVVQARTAKEHYEEQERIWQEQLHEAEQA